MAYSGPASHQGCGSNTLKNPAQHKEAENAGASFAQRGSWPANRSKQNNMYPEEMPGPGAGQRHFPNKPVSN